VEPVSTSTFDTPEQALTETLFLALIAPGESEAQAAAKLAEELPNLPLEDALQLVHLYFERGSPKAEPAARRWLVRYLSEGTPSLRDVAKVTASLASASAGTRTDYRIGRIEPR